METTVVNKYKSQYDVYIGRGSIWGNPYTQIKDQLTKAEFVVETREEAIEKYKIWFYEQLKDEYFKSQTLKLKGARLGCFCKPKSCHGDVIVEYLEGNKNAT
jgi:hypothetical protein